LISPNDQYNLRHDLQKIRLKRAKPKRFSPMVQLITPPTVRSPRCKSLIC